VLQGGTKAVGIAGTPAFMAPELLSQDAALYDGPAVDLWSCGATLFMLVTGVVRFGD
jgi:serine/threonine-protein kinase SRK2